VTGTREDPTAVRTTGLDDVRARIAASSAGEVLTGSLARAREIAGLGAFTTLADSPGGGPGPLAGVPSR
jgi:hypothetical protein